MSARLVTKFRFFWDDADHALERWLQEMARQGLHLQKVGFMRCRFVFRRGAPAEMSYRLDFRVNRASPDYLQLFADAGWEHVDQVLGWQFWRAPAHAGRSLEIFTDVESRITKYQRLLWLFAFVWVLGIVLLFRRGDRVWDTPMNMALTLFLVALNVYPVARLLLRIRRLRNPTS